MNFDKEAKSDKKKYFHNFEYQGFEGGGGGGGAGTETKTVFQMRSIQKCNYLRYVEHVVQSTFQKTLISF